MFIRASFLKGTRRIIKQRYTTSTTRILTTSLLLAINSSHYNADVIKVVKCHKFADLENGTDDDSNKKDTNEEDNRDEDESCPFCRYFLDSPCRSAFQKWRVCVKDAEEATDCMEPFFPLKQCMDEHGLFESPENADKSVKTKDDIEL